MPLIFNHQSEVNLTPKRERFCRQSFEKHKKAEGAVARVEKRKLPSRMQEVRMLIRAVFQKRTNKQRIGSEGIHAASVWQKGNTTSRHRQSQTGSGEQRAALPRAPQVRFIYSLSEALSPKKGSCSIMSMGILMLGTFSL